MAFRSSKGTNPFFAVVAGDNAVRKVKIRNMQRDEIEAKAAWRDQQILAFPTAPVVSDEPTLAKILIEENRGGTQDEFVINSRAMEHLVRVCGDQTIAEYVLDRLDIDERIFWNLRFKSLVKEIHKGSERVDKDTFVRYIKQEKERAEANGDISGTLRDRIQNQPLPPSDLGNQRLQRHVDFAQQQQAAAFDRRDALRQKYDQESADTNTSQQYYNLGETNHVVYSAADGNDYTEINGIVQPLADYTDLGLIEAAQTMGANLDPDIYFVYDDGSGVLEVMKKLTNRGAEFVRRVDGGLKRTAEGQEAALNHFGLPIPQDLARKLARRRAGGAGGAGGAAPVPAPAPAPAPPARPPAPPALQAPAARPPAPALQPVLALQQVPARPPPPPLLQALARPGPPLQAQIQPRPPPPPPAPPAPAIQPRGAAPPRLLNPMQAALRRHSLGSMSPQSSKISSFARGYPTPTSDDRALGQAAMGLASLNYAGVTPSMLPVLAQMTPQSAASADPRLLNTATPSMATFPGSGGGTGGATITSLQAAASHTTDPNRPSLAMQLFPQADPADAAGSALQPPPPPPPPPRVATTDPDLLFKDKIVTEEAFRGFSQENKKFILLGFGNKDDPSFRKLQSDFVDGLTASPGSISSPMGYESKVKSFLKQNGIASMKGLDAFVTDTTPVSIERNATLYACLKYGKQIASLVPKKSGIPKKAGKGLSFKLKRRMMRGSGVAQILETRTKQFHVLDKVMVDLKKLRDNILCIKYTQSGAHHTKLPPIKITSECRDMVKDILAGSFNKRLFEKMDRDDKRVIKNFVRRCHIDLDVTDSDDDDFEKQFQILKGEYLSGNDNPKLKKDLQRYVVTGITESRIPRNQGMLLLYQLSL